MSGNSRGRWSGGKRDGAEAGKVRGRSPCRAHWPLFYFCLCGLLLGLPGPAEALPIYITFVWHMHQPIYWPGENLVQTENAGHYSFSVIQVHLDRSGAYTTWPRDAIAAARSAGLMSVGAQVSLTGSLMENLDSLEAADIGFQGWKEPWREAVTWRTDGGNPSLDLIGFGSFHPLMGLVEGADITAQILMHRAALQRRFPGMQVSRGLFPPETAFSERMIPALVKAGVEWVVVDNIHFDRTLPDYPYSPASNLIPPNPADQRSSARPSWVQLNGLWAPSAVSAPWGYQPHYAIYLDPETGEESRIVVVPGARYEGNEDARGGFGALDYEEVLSQLEPYNQDPNHPILVVLHHDGDNYGGGAESYYHGNFSQFVSWLQANPDRFQGITIQDYLDQFPPDRNDVIHVEDGSWSGADNGDPEFDKWNGDPDSSGYSPDRNSWAVITAARNRVLTATALAGGMPPVEDILDGIGDVAAAWRALLMAEASDYWYWDGTESWDSQPTRAANFATDAVGAILSGLGAEAVPPTIYLPQREPYNPGGMEWGPNSEPETVTFWTFVYDVSGLSRVELLYRFDDDGAVSRGNMLYAGGTWCRVPMSSYQMSPRTNPLPNYQADRYEAEVPDLAGSLIDYYVEAEDNQGNVAKSPIQHVMVQGQGGIGQGWSGISFYPSDPTMRDVITVTADAPGTVHWGVNGWRLPAQEYRPPGTTEFGDGHAIETPLSGPDAMGRHLAVLGPFDGSQSVTSLDFVIHYADDTWSSPDQHVSITPFQGERPTIEIVRPRDGASVSGTVWIVAAAADDQGVAEVTFQVDGSLLATLTERPYELAWDTTPLAPGDHEIRVEVRDGDGLSSQENVTIRVGGGAGDCRVHDDGDGGSGSRQDGSGADDGVGFPDGAETDGGAAGDAERRADASGADWRGASGCSCGASGGRSVGGLVWILALLFVVRLMSNKVR